MRIPYAHAAPKKSRYAALIEQVAELHEEMLKLRAAMRALVAAEVEKNLGDKIAMIDGALTETILQKEVLIEKGLMTRAEINEKYAALRASREN